MAEYVWHHDLKGEADRLRLMSDLLDPSSEFHLSQIGVGTGSRCLEIGAGNGSLSQWLAQRVGPSGHVIASDIRTDLMHGIAGNNLEVRKFDVVHDEPSDAPYDLIAIRALLHHLPERRAVVSKVAGWLRPGGYLLIQEPDFYPTWTVEPPPRNSSGSNSFTGRRPTRSTITSGAKFPRGCKQRAWPISPPKGMPFSITAARSSRNGGTMGFVKSQTSCKPRAASRKQHSMSSSPAIATPPTGQQRLRLQQPLHSARSCLTEVHIG
jgi:SAM-dependent methyltransferase